MVRTQTHEQKKPSSQQIAADKMTPVQKISRALQSGPVKSELRTVQEAIHLARALSSQAKSMMDGTKGADHAKDFGVHIAYMTPDLSVLHTLKYEAGQEAAIQAELSGGSGKCCIMVGLVFGMRDHSKGGMWYFGGRPFLNTELVRMALAQRMQESGAAQDYSA
jgi:hypothetical protein